MEWVVGWLNGEEGDLGVGNKLSGLDQDWEMELIGGRRCVGGDK